MSPHAVWLAAALAGCAAAPPTGGDREVARDLAAATTRFLDGLSDAQRRAAVRELADDETGRWHFVPGRYAGVELGALAPAQRALAHDVLRAMLSVEGFAKTVAIVALEDVLRELESRPDRVAAHRDPGRYALLVCGEPGADGAFVVRFQGHHVSLRAAVVDGALVGFTPHFLGSNPHVVPARFARPTVLADEERVARELLRTLDPDKRARAIVADEAPPDVLLGPGRPPAALGDRRGLPWADMDAAERGVLWRLLEVYARRYRGALADQELARIRGDRLDELSFAWAGSTEPGAPHYYRLHGASFAIEYDNTQNDANHVHTVWRDFARDFGGDALREHLERAHADPADRQRTATFRRGDAARSAPSVARRW